MARSEKIDEQSADLLRQIYRHFSKRLQLTPNEQAAFNRLLTGMARENEWDGALHRNNIFKVANLLGIKLPSSIF
jgi:hypothetical protein